MLTNNYLFKEECYDIGTLLLPQDFPSLVVLFKTTKSVRPKTQILFL